jgi:serine protease Do
MTRLERAAIVFFIAIVVPQIFAHYPGSFDDGNDRRPLETPDTAPPPTPDAQGSPGDRVRRPLPQAAPEDPLITVDTEALEPGTIAFGTAFPIGGGAFLTARHVANADCQKVVLILNGKKVPAQIQYLHPYADLAVLKAPAAGGAPLPLETGGLNTSDTGYSFGYPQEKLGATEDRLMGRSRMELNGELGGVGPVLTWAETQRFPDALPVLSGMSGGPMLDENGKVVGIMVAASVRRGRVHSVAPEILQTTEQAFALDPSAASAAPAQEVEGQSVSLGDAAGALSGEGRIVKTYCLPAT